jgi:hypothetical protein
MPTQETEIRSKPRSPKAAAPACRKYADDPQATYAYDPIGNWTASSPDPNTLATHLTDQSKQYGPVEVNGAAKLRRGLRYDDDGNLVEQFVAADMNCSGVLGFGDINPMVLALSNPSARHAPAPAAALQVRVSDSLASLEPGVSTRSWHCSMQCAC